jgi:tetratricopeptide (TPR) repeat protein
LLFTGQPGIGKTWLADEGAAYAASRGMRGYWGRCFEGGGAPAYWPWIQVLRGVITDAGSHHSRTLPADIVRVLPELAAEAPQPEAGDAEQLRFRLFDAVARLLRECASDTPIMAVLDDLHDADVASLQLLKFVARVAHDARLIIVGTYRDAEMRHSPERAAIISDILRDATHFRLEGLAEDEVGRMVEVRAQHAPDPEFVAALCRTTAGNPLFVDGIIRVLAAEGRFGSPQPIALANYKLPDEVHAAIQRWLGLLSPAARTLLTTAALIGLEFEPGLLGKATATAPERVAELINSAQEVGIASFVRKSLWGFAHPLLREVLSQEPTPGERARLHRAIARALEEIQGADTVYLAQLAHHYQLAGDDERAIDYSIRAAAAAHSIYAYEQEILHLATAKDLAEKSNQNAARRASILDNLGIAIDNINQTSSEAKEILESAAKLYEETGEVSSAARVLIRLGSSVRFDVSLPSALAYLKRAESLLVGKEEDETLAALYVAMSDTCYFLGKYEDGLRWSQLAMELAEKIGSPTRWVHAASAFAQMLFYIGSLDEGLGLLRTALSKAIELGSPELTSLVSMAIDNVMGEVWDPLKGIDILLSERARPGVANRWSILIQIDDRLVKRSLMAGKIAQAHEMFLKTAAFIEVHGRGFTFESTLADSSRASFCRAEGDWQEASDRLAQSVRTFRAQENQHSAAHCLGAQSRAERFRGDLVRAKALEQEALELLPHDPHIEMQIRPQLASLCAEMNQPDEAESVLMRCREILSAGEDWRGLAGNICMAEAMIAAARGEMNRAEIEFLRAIEIFVRYQLPFEQAEALYCWGRVLATRGETTVASEKFDRAIEIYRGIGAGQPWIDRVEAERVATSVRTSGNNIPGEALFRRERDFWTIRYAEKLLRLRNSKGLGYIAQLLRYPEREIHALVLTGGAEMNGLGGAGEILDSTARSDYRHRIEELREDLEEAERFNDEGRAAKARADLDELESHLARAIGLGGRSRRASTDAERARVAVTKGIKAAIKQIRAIDPELGRHLSTTVSTGYFCCYHLDHDHPVSWQF